ncbi:MAG: hypothetical protein L0Y72_28005 [Gemmataceae bacterium]|nr:hypothetical protein [Gemmataceae bacterium]MCI0742892.1 hypothetical protein [Gemmataceae bacterium]
MAITWTKLVSLLIAVAYSVAAAVYEWSVGTGLIVFAISLLPLALIWFPDRLGAPWPRKKTRLYTYEKVSGRGGASYRDSHPFVVALMGWFFLVGLPVLLFFLWR